MRHLTGLRLKWLCVVLAGAGACALTRPAPSGGTSLDGGAISLQFVPEPTNLAIAPVVQAVIRIPEGTASDNVQAICVQGTVTLRDLQSISDGTPSDSLSARLANVVQWPDPSSALVQHVAVMNILTKGDTYTFAIPALGWQQQAQVIEDDDEPILAPLWPPADAGNSIAWAAWCASNKPTGQVSDNPQPVTGDTGDVIATMSDGALPGLGQQCIRWQSDWGQPGDWLVSPPEWADADGQSVRLSPLVLSRAQPSTDAPGGAGCPTDFQALGPVCVLVSDDRVELRVAAGPVLLGALSGNWAGAQVADRSSGLLIRPVAPDTDVPLAIHVVDETGSYAYWEGNVHTVPSQPHIVLNEVMANPLGQEPDQEWVELANDGLDAVDIGGWAILDNGGTTVLPSASIAPGQFVLVVPDTFDPASSADRPPAGGTLLVRVAKLGKNGLSNDGEALRLIDPSGIDRSDVPAVAASKGGVSLSRISLGDPSSDLGAFEWCLGGGTPGEDNTTCTNRSPVKK